MEIEVSQKIITNLLDAISFAKTDCRGRFLFT